MADSRSAKTPGWPTLCEFGFGKGWGCFLLASFVLSVPHPRGFFQGAGFLCAPCPLFPVVFVLLFLVDRDAKTHHMKKVTVRDLRHRFSRIEDFLRNGEEVHITKRNRVVARLLPPEPPPPKAFPDFLARQRKIFGKKHLKVSGAEIISLDREERF